jgi:hypothetical protein
MRRVLLAVLLCSFACAGFAQTTSYCLPNFIENHINVNSVLLGTINNTTGRNAGTYTSYVTAPTATQTTDLAQGSKQTIVISLKGFAYENNVAAWIDYNQDGDFDDLGEEVGNTGYQPDGANVTFTFSAPATAVIGTTRLRVIAGSPYPGLSPCVDARYYYGETEDYRITVLAQTACTGTPLPGSAVTSNGSPVCLATSFNLSVSSYPADASGITYQWEISTTSAGGPFTALAGQNQVTAVVTGQAQNSWYRLKATCTSSGQSGTSSAIAVTQQIAANCYCKPLYQNSSSRSYINSLQLGSINNVTGRPWANAYTSFASSPSANQTTTLIQGSLQNLKLNLFASYGSADFVLWIDYNQDGDFFDSGERVGTGDLAYYDDEGYGDVNIGFTVPQTALPGQTRMRVRTVHSISADDIDPCTYLEEGEAEDYLITIVTPCSVQPVTTSIAADGPTTFCKGNSVILTASGANTYLWNTGATTSSITVGDAGTYSVVGTNTIGCSDTSTSVTVTTGTPANAGTNGTLTVCDGTPITDAQLFAALGGSPNAGGSWSPARTGAGTYTYSVAGTAPCTGTATASVTVTTVNKTINAGCYSATIARSYNPSANSTTFTYNVCANGCSSALGYIAFITQTSSKVLAPLNGAAYKTALNTYTVSVPVGNENGKMVYGIKYDFTKGTSIKNKGECANFTFTLAGNVPVDAITVRFKAGTAVTDGVATCPLQTSLNSMLNSQQAFKEQDYLLDGMIKAYPNPTTNAFTLQLNNQKTETAHILILNNRGGTVEQRQVTLSQGTQTLPFNLKGRTSGLYFVQVRSESGTRTFKIYLQH